MFQGEADIGASSDLREESPLNMQTFFNHIMDHIVGSNALFRHLGLSRTTVHAHAAQLTITLGSFGEDDLHKTILSISINAYIMRTQV